MAVKTLTVVSLLILLSVCFARPFREDPNTNVSCDLLVRQLANLKGIKQCYMIVKSRVKSSTVLNVLTTKLTRLLPIMQLTLYKRFDWSRYAKKEINYRDDSESNKKSREQKGILNTVSGSTLLIYVFVPPKSQLIFQNSVKWIYESLTAHTSIPKVLLISLRNKPRVHYKKNFWLVA